MLVKGEEFQITNVLHIVNHIYCHNFNTNVIYTIQRPKLVNGAISVHRTVADSGGGGGKGGANAPPFGGE